MDEWIAKIEELWGHYSKAEYAAVLDEGSRVVNEAPASLSTLLYIALADCVLQMDEMDRATEYMKKAREHFTSESFIVDEPTLVSKENMPYLYRGELSKCRRNLVLSNFQESYLVQSHLAHCNYWLGEFEDALTEYQGALRLCLDNENLQEEAHICRLGQARCHAQLNDLQAAEKLLREIYPQQRNRLDENASEVIVATAGFLACVEAWQGRVPEGRLMFQTDLDPDAFQHPYKKSCCHMYRGIVRLVAGTMDGAREDLKAVVDAPVRTFDKLEAFVYLGDIATKEGDVPQARLWYEKAALFSEVFPGKRAKTSLAQLELVEEAVDLGLIKGDVAAEVPQPPVVPPAENIPIAAAASPVEEESAEIWSELPLSAILLGLETLDLKKR